MLSCTDILTILLNSNDIIYEPKYETTIQGVVRMYSESILETNIHVLFVFMLGTDSIMLPICKLYCFQENRLRGNVTVMTK